MSRIDSFLKRSPLKIIVSRKLVSFSEISVVNLIVGWNLLACLMKRLTSFLSLSYSEKMSSIKRFHSIERFHSRDYRPYWFTETKESISIKIEFNSQRFSFGHQHGRRDVM